jgi:methionyl aminopeptidase
MYTRIKTESEIENMRAGGKILAQVLERLKTHVKPGVTTQSLNDIATKEIKKLGGEAAFLGYQGFPSVICISVNDAVVHGIPDETKLRDGDIVSMDLGIRYKGMIVDGARTIVCGASNAQKDNLLKYTQSSLEAGLTVIKHGCKTGDIGNAVQTVLLKGNYGIVRDLVGHGVGHAIHEDPNVPNFGRANTGDRLVAGMTIAVEPMATIGKEAVYTDVDGWTVRTQDGSLSAHFEDTILITQDGFEVLTAL